MNRWIARGRLVADPTRPRVMGILNVTPDSFSDGGIDARVEDALDRAHAMVRAGADLLDIGGESSRPGAEPVALDEELRRVMPVIEGLAGQLDVPISIDTTKPEVARRALHAGAAVINDIRALGATEMASLAAEFDAGVVLMHMQGDPKTMQLDPDYTDVVEEVYAMLARRIEYAESFGIGRDRIAIDPGIGFGKKSRHNLSLLRNLRRFASLGCTVLVGTSRKRFLGTLTGRDVSDRVTGSVVSSLAAITRGADVVRVHDVGPMVDGLSVWRVIQAEDESI